MLVFLFSHFLKTFPPPFFNISSPLSHLPISLQYLPSQSISPVSQIPATTKELRDNVLYNQQTLKLTPLCYRTLSILLYLILLSYTTAISPIRTVDNKRSFYHTAHQSKRVRNQTPSVRKTTRLEPFCWWVALLTANHGLTR